MEIKFSELLEMLLKFAKSNQGLLQADAHQIHLQGLEVPAALII